jgi:hypothetical protein
MVQAHLYRYVDVKPHERELLTWYAIYTWFYRKSATSPYLRFLADTGKGKSRLVRATGDLCFLPITAGGSSTRSGIMRFKEKWQGTLLIDESDLSGGAEDPLIKYLNLGFERGQYFILSDKNDPKQQEFYDPFGPKVIGMRQPFGDVATEGRCLSITPYETERRDIPVELGKEYHEAVQQVRAHIARFVLTHWNEIDGETLMDCSDIDVEPRLKQMLRPLSIVLQLYPDGEERFRQYMLDRQQEVKKQRACRGKAPCSTGVLPCNRRYHARRGAIPAVLRPHRASAGRDPGNGRRPSQGIAPVGDNRAYRDRVRE